MAGESNRLSAGLFVLLLLLSTSSSLLLPKDGASGEATTFNPEWVRFDVREDVYREAQGLLDEGLSTETRAPLAQSPMGVFDVGGLRLNQPVPEALLEPRFDVLLLIVSNELRLQDVRGGLGQVPGLAVREYIAPSGLLVQGTPAALVEAEQQPGVMTSHAVPLGFFLDQDLLDIVLFEQGESALEIGRASCRERV